MMEYWKKRNGIRVDTSLRLGDRVALVSTLRRLQLRPVTVALLTETKIGVTVSSLKSHVDAEVATSAGLYKLTFG